MTDRIDSPYWFEFDRKILEWHQRPDKTWEHVQVGIRRLSAQVLTISIETQNVRVRTFDVPSGDFFGTFDMNSEEFWKNFELFKKVTPP